MKKLFIHIPKNGGMSIRRNDTLRPMVQICNASTHKSRDYSEAVRKTMKQSDDHHGWEHARWRDLKPMYQAMPAFAIIRNPWARVASRYMFCKAESPEGYADVSSLEAFLEERHKWGGKQYYWHRAIRGWYNALDYVTDDLGVVRCDMLRLEHLTEDLNKYFNLLTTYPQRNITRFEYSYKDLYTPQTIQIVADWYAQDIDYWGFDFDSAATKNYWNKDASF